ncbi:MAG: hypothetical protein PHF67_05675 [Candidatus Nanoarchaeia archaeon]|nr:hypothetical protein [Candidatus Nanoarchaeia archaeon]
MNEKNLFILGSVLLILSILNSGVLTAAKVYTLQDYEASIDYSCERALDCEIKDIHSCCGYYPKCVNKNSIANATLVSELCSSVSNTGYCGYKNIQSCKCENKKCVGSEEAVNDYDYCDYDSDCACGTNVQTGNCFRGNKKYVDEKAQCPDFCSGISGDFITICRNHTCAYEKNFPGSENVNKVKILPETASERARERLGELGFNITLKEVPVGNGNETKYIYEAKAKREFKVLGFMKVKGDVSAEIDGETGEVTKVHKPWWSFIASEN